MGLLDGRVALVTGGGRGIGRSHCLELAAHGATVVVNDPGVGRAGEVDVLNPADEVMQEIESAGGRASTDMTSVTDFWGERPDLHDDRPVWPAGCGREQRRDRPRPMITSLAEEDWDAVIAVHLKGTFNVTKHACDHWRTVAKAGGQVSGRIINTTSGTGLFGNIGQAAYGAAKAAVANLTLITAMEMARYGVTANAISPLAYTRMTESLPHMQGYQPDPEWDRMDLADSSPVVVWLASLDSGWFSGAILRVDGNSVQQVRGWSNDSDASFHGAPSKPICADDLSLGMRKAFGAFPRGLPTTTVG